VCRKKANVYYAHYWKIVFAVLLPNQVDLPKESIDIAVCDFDVALDHTERTFSNLF
jgi:hypothetical protein